MVRTATYTKNALDKLMLLEDKLGSDVAFFVEPNMILTLSGVRGFADHITYYKLASDRDKILAVFSAAQSIQEKLDLQIFPEASQNVSGKPLVACEVINLTGLRRTLGMTKLVSMSAPAAISTYEDYMAWYAEYLKKVAQNHPGTSYAAQQDIAFGIVLGYPDVAIKSILEETEENGSDYMDARIACATQYVCPQPIYSYHKKLKDYSEITYHEELWSEILQAVYQSEWHQRIAKDKNFNAVRAFIEKY